MRISGLGCLGAAEYAPRKEILPALYLKKPERRRLTAFGKG